MTRKRKPRPEPHAPEPPVAPAVAASEPAAAEPALRLEWRSPAELAENPANWRRHPQEQIGALTGAIAEVGWAGACLFNETTGRLIDGHARRKAAMEQGAEKVPVLVGRWTEDQERKILATLDPLAAMAEADPVALAALLAQIDTESAELQAMLDAMGAERDPAAAAEASKSTDVFAFLVRCKEEDRRAIEQFTGLDALPKGQIGKVVLERIKALIAK